MEPDVPRRVAVGSERGGGTRCVLGADAGADRGFDGVVGEVEFVRDGRQQLGFGVVDVAVGDRDLGGEPECERASLPGEGVRETVRDLPCVRRLARVRLDARLDALRVLVGEQFECTVPDRRGLPAVGVPVRDHHRDAQSEQATEEEFVVCLPGRVELYGVREVVEVHARLRELTGEFRVRPAVDRATTDVPEDDQRVDQGRHRPPAQ